MKKLITLTMILAILFSICGCSSNGDNTENVELSQADKQNIELINNSIKKWDVTVRDGSEDISINKIGFNKVELSDMGVSGVGFFVNYPIGGYYGSCIIIDSSNKKIERLDINKLQMKKLILTDTLCKLQLTVLIGIVMLLMNKNILLLKRLTKSI